MLLARRLALLLGLGAVALGYLSLPANPNPHQRPTELGFKKEQGEAPDKEGKPNGWLRFIPEIVRSKFTKSFETPMPDTRSRYELRLVAPVERDKRHIITRIMRFLPDVSYQSAEQMVLEALERDRALVRATSSRADAEALFDMLRRADPPVKTEVYDSKADQVIFE